MLSYEVLLDEVTHAKLTSVQEELIMGNVTTI